MKQFDESNVSLNLRKITLILLLVAGSSAGLAACDLNQGPAEEAGEEIDESAEEIEDEMDENT